MKWNTYPIKRKVANFPIHLDIELNTTCNLKCTMCFQSFDPPEAQIMPLRMVKKILLEGKREGLCSVKLNYRGEPLLYPHLVEVVRFAKEMGVIEVMFNTNGMLLDLDKAYKLTKAGLDLIIFSVDDHRHKEYKKYRKGSDLGIVTNNIRNLLVMREFHHSNIPKIRIQKLDRTPEMNSAYSKYFSPLSDYIGFHTLLDYRVKSNPKPMPNWCCASLWQRMVILADGSIIACCGLNGKFSRLGHISNDTLQSVWLGQSMTKYREHHTLGTSHRIRACRNCALRLHYINTEKYL